METANAPLFDLPFGVDITDLNPTIVRDLLMPSRSSETYSVLGNETEDEDEDGYSSGDDDDDEACDEKTMKRKADHDVYLENARVDKRGRFS